MNWTVVAAVSSMFGVLCTVIGVAYISGRVTKQVESNTLDISKHDVRLDGHDDKLNEHDVELGKLHEWKNGYNAAARISGNNGAVQS